MAPPGAVDAALVVGGDNGGVEVLAAPQPRRWYCLVKVQGDGLAAASVEDAGVVAAQLSVDDVRACNSPALSVSLEDSCPVGAPDSPETSVHGHAPVFRYVPSKQGGPCDHCGTHGASARVMAHR
jgi:hypothetical protein